MTCDVVLPAGTATLHLLDSVFGGGFRRTSRVEAGRSIAETLSAHWPSEWSSERPPQLVLVVNGRVELDPWTLVRAGDHVAVYPRTSDPVSIGATVAAAIGATGVTATIVTGVVAIGVALAYSYGVSALLAPDAPDTPQADNSRPHYAWDGVTTEYRGYGATIPCVYGEQVVGGTVISYAVRSRSGRSVLRLLLALSHGPVESIAGVARDLDNASGSDIGTTDFRLNGTPVSEWGDIVRIWTRRGAIDQSPIPGMNDEERTYTHGVRVRYTERNDADKGRYLTRTPVDAVLLRFTFPQGLIWLDNHGADHTAAVDFEVRFHRQDVSVTDATWSPWTGFRLNGRQTDPLQRDYYVELPARHAYIVQVRRLTPEPITTEGLLSRSRVELTQVVEVVQRDLEYPGLALCALEVNAVDGLSGGRPSVEIPLRGIQVQVPDTNDQDTTSHTRTWTRSPPWVAYDLLRNTDYGLGYATRYMRFNLAEWRAAAADAADLVAADLETALVVAAGAGSTVLRVESTAGFAAGDQMKLAIGLVGEELVAVAEVARDDELKLATPLAAAHAAGVTLTKVHPRYEWDGVVDGAASPWDTVQQILGTARARLVKQGNDFILVRAVPREPVMLICEGNGADDFVETFESPRGQPNALDLQFWNRTTRYQRDNLLVLAEDAVLDRADVATFFRRESLDPKDEQAYGITRPEQVRRHGRYRLRQLRQATRGWSCTLPLEAVTARVGEIVAIAHRVVIATTWSGRTTATAASGTSTIRLDQPVVLDAGVTYAVRVRVGTSSLVTRALTSAAGSYARGAALSISGTWPGDVDAGAPYALGVQGQETVLAEVVGHAVQEDFRVAVAAKEYVEANLADV